MTRALLVLLAVAFGTLAADPSCAQTFPNHVVRIIVPFPAGGPTDLLARHVGQRLSAALGQGVIVENEAGAGGRTGTQAVARANPDGYTLLLGGTNSNAMAAALYKTLGYDPIRDFVAVASIAINSNALVINLVAVCLVIGKSKRSPREPKPNTNPRHSRTTDRAKSVVPARTKRRDRLVCRPPQRHPGQYLRPQPTPTARRTRYASASVERHAMPRRAATAMEMTVRYDMGFPFPR